MSETNVLIAGLWDALVVASITAAALTPLAWILSRLLRRSSPEGRYQIWSYVLLAVVTLPALWTYTPKVAIPLPPPHDTLARTLPWVSVVEPHSSGPGALGEVKEAGRARASLPASAPWSVEPLLVALWLAGAALMLSRLLIGGARLRRIRRRAQRVPIEQALTLTDGAELHLALSQEIEGPLCSGPFRPIVLLPRRLFETESRDGLRMILAHEMAHVRRRDYFKIMLQRFVEAVFFFHPCVWYASRELTRERELLCDREVIHTGASATAYAKLLSSMAERGLQAIPLQTAGLREAELLWRVRSVLDRAQMQHPSPSRRSHIVFGALASGLLLAAGTVRLKAQSPATGPSLSAPASHQDSAQASQVKKDLNALARALLAFERRWGKFPKQLDRLDTPIPPDPYSPSGAAYHFEADRVHFLLESCGPDGTYGNEDDLLLYYGVKATGFGTRAALEPLPKLDPNAQVEERFSKWPRPRGSCAVGGRVVSAENGRAVPHATVYLFHVTTATPMFLRVAADGSFLFEAVPCGEYALRTTRTAGYQDGTYNPEDAQGGLPRFTLAEGEQRTDVLFELRAAYSLSGNVSSEDGSPLPDRDGLTVLAWAEATDGGFEIIRQQPLRNGHYRMDGLDGRPVYVMVVDRRRDGGESGYCPQYAPGTFSRDEASQIVFESKRHIGSVDPRLKRPGGILLEGYVSDETGHPVPDAFVVIHRSDMLFDLITATTDEQGRYERPCLAKGDFVVHVDAVQHNLVRTRSPLEISGTNERERLDFTLHQGVKITGRLVDEQGRPWQIGRGGGSAQISGASPASPSFTLTGFYNKHRTRGVQDDWGELSQPGDGDYAEARMVFPTKSTFVLEGVMPDPTRIEFRSRREGQTVKKILYGGKDITETGLVTQPGDVLSSVSIVIGKRP